MRNAPRHVQRVGVQFLRALRPVAPHTTTAPMPPIKLYNNETLARALRLTCPEWMYVVPRPFLACNAIVARS